MDLIREANRWINENDDYTAIQALNNIPKEYYKYKNILYKAFVDEEVYGLNDVVINNILSTIKKFEELYGDNYNISKLNSIGDIEKLIRKYKKKVNKSTSMLIYSGQKGDKPEFDLDKLGKGNDEHGPGFYFSTNKNDAYHYASPKGIIITSDMSKINIVDANYKVDQSDMLKLIKMADREDLRRYYNDGGTNDMLIDDNFHDTVNNIWYDIYTPSKSGKCVYNLSKLGYDGMIYSAYDDVKHVIIYSPDKLKIIDVEHIK